MLDEITPLILTYNEERNIARTLRPLGWAREIVVIDSGSTDSTLDIIRSFRPVRVVQRMSDSFGSQCNLRRDQDSTGRVLSLDADYVLSDQLRDEIRELAPTARISGYQVPFLYCTYGKPLRA